MTMEEKIEEKVEIEEGKRVQEADFLTRWLLMTAVAKIARKIAKEHRLEAQDIYRILSDKEGLRIGLERMLVSSSTPESEEQEETTKDASAIFLEELASGEEVWLRETNGRERISQEKKLFSGHIAEPFYREAFRGPEKPRPSIKAKVYVFSGAPDPISVFNRIGGHPGRLALSQGQAIGFCREYLSRYLRDGRMGVFFPTKVKGRYRLIYARQSELGLSATLLRLDSEYPWLAEETNILVVPED